MSTATWTCPSCERRFATRNQSHECAPAMAIDDYFATEGAPAHERPVFEAVLDALRRAGVDDVHVEPVSVGILLKRDRTFAELRPKDRWVALSFGLDRTVRHRLITRKVVPYGSRFHHFVHLRRPEDLDDEIVGWLVEAYEAASAATSSGESGRARRSSSARAARSIPNSPDPS